MGSITADLSPTSEPGQESFKSELDFQPRSFKYFTTTKKKHCYIVKNINSRDPGSQLPPKSRLKLGHFGETTHFLYFDRNTSKQSIDPVQVLYLNSVPLRNLSKSTTDKHISFCTANVNYSAPFRSIVNGFEHDLHHCASVTQAGTSIPSS